MVDIPDSHSDFISIICWVVSTIAVATSPIAPTIPPCEIALTMLPIEPPN